MYTMSTETFPYTMAYVCEAFHMDESTVMALCHSLGVQPHQDERTGKLFFGIKDIERIREATENKQSGASLNSLAKTAASVPAQPKTYATVPQRPGALSRTDLSQIVESVSTAKEEILKDLSMLLDDKLAGLDDVVVELIRSKSENDSLREELKRAQEIRDQAKAELTKFRPAAFGFYRKES